MVYVKCSWNRLIAIRQKNIGIDISNRLVTITFYGHAPAEPIVLLVGSVPLLLQASCCFIRLICDCSYSLRFQFGFNFRTIAS